MRAWEVVLVCFAVGMATAAAQARREYHARLAEINGIYLAGLRRAGL